MPILAVIGERQLARRACPSQPSFERLGRTEIRDKDSVAINPDSLADCTGIPRETVRRKAAADLAGSTGATPDCIRGIAASLDGG